MRYKYLFWDLDHTLWDFEKNSGITLKFLYDKYNLRTLGIESFEPFRIKYEYFNELLWQQLIEGKIDRITLRWKRMSMVLETFGVSNLELAHTLSDAYLELLPKQSELIHYAEEVLTYCNKKGYKMYLITNGFEKTQREKIISSKIDHYFEAMFTSENSNSMKPHRPIFDYAINNSKAALSESLMIGDSLQADILGAMNYQMDQIWFNPTNIHSDVQPTFEVKCLQEICNIL